MELTYDSLNTDELHGAAQADYLVSFDAHFRLINGAGAIYEEPAFPVVELARSLLIWLDSPDRKDFEFDSMSYEEAGPIAIRQHAAGWAVESVFAPGASTPPLGWGEVERCCRDFVSRVEHDLLALGLDPAEVIHQ